VTEPTLSIATPPGPGWVQLLVEPPKRKLFGSKRGIEKPLTDWAAAKAREILGPDATPDAASAYAELLTRLSRGGRERGEQLAFAWFPEPGGSPVARMSVSKFRPESGTPTLDTLQAKVGWRDDQTRSLEVQATDLPAGPAIRARREEAVGEVIVSITYGFLPPRLETALIFTMFWNLSDDRPMFTEIADSSAKSLRIVY
jgi:hypothetical protein